jgi:hypothetical protein
LDTVDGAAPRVLESTTLFEISSVVGTPLTLDDSTAKRAFGNYARVLVDIDLSRRLFDEITVERDGFAFQVEVVYERLPAFLSSLFNNWP